MTDHNSPKVFKAEVPLGFLNLNVFYVQGLENFPVLMAKASFGLELNTKHSQKETFIVHANDYVAITAAVLNTSLVTVSRGTRKMALRLMQEYNDEQAVVIQPAGRYDSIVTYDEEIVHEEPLFVGQEIHVRESEYTTVVNTVNAAIKRVEGL